MTNKARLEQRKPQKNEKACEYRVGVRRAAREFYSFADAFNFAIGTNAGHKTQGGTGESEGKSPQSTLPMRLLIYSPEHAHSSVLSRGSICGESSFHRTLDFFFITIPAFLLSMLKGSGDCDCDVSDITIRVIIILI